MFTAHDVKSSIKAAVRIALGERQFAKLSSTRSRRMQQRLVSKWGLPDITRRLIKECGLTVQNGPFKGMVYPEAVLLERVGAPLLVGSYESELHPVFSSASWHEYDSAIDVGCGEGYFAVGMAKTFGVHVYAFDTAASERVRCKSLASMNGVASKVTTRDWIDPGILAELCLGRRCFVLSDCEGYEIDLFTSDIVQALSDSDLLIETHDGAGPLVVSQTLTERLKATHEVVSIHAKPRDPSDYPELACLGSAAGAAVAEYRNEGQIWLWCKARTRTASHA